MIKITATDKRGKPCMWLAHPGTNSKGKPEYRTEFRIYTKGDHYERSTYNYIRRDEIDEEAERVLTVLKESGYTDIQLER